jgi:S1-C subfamily serine protease
MEELNKNQIVLLTLLVSFVTSIATGIVTVTLMNQAPAAVTQTINRIVERTVEKVVPGEPKVTTVVKEVPVVVTEEKLIVDVINQASPAVVRVADAEGKTTLGSGFVVSETGLVATAAAIFTPPASPSGGPVPPGGPIEGNQSPPGGTPPGYSVFFANGKKVNAWRVQSGVSQGVALLRIDLGALAESASPPGGAATSTKPAAVLPLETEEVLAGQTVVALGLGEGNVINVAGGIISSVVKDKGAPLLLRTNAANQTNLGGPLLNLKGKVIGINTEAGVSLPAAIIDATGKAVVNS